MAYGNKRRRASYASYRPVIGNMVGRVVRYGARRAGSYLYNRYFKKGSPETGVTSQYDKVTQYSKKSMPRRQKKIWRKFVKKVQAANDKTLGTRTVLFNDKMSMTEVSGNQTIGSATLYGFCGTDTAYAHGNRDIFRMCNNDSDIMLNGTDGQNASKIVFKSGVIDFTFRNTGLDGLEVDLYEINVMTDATKEPNFQLSVIEAEAKTNTMSGSTGSALRLINRGTTLFDFPNLLSADRLKIYKKKKFFLPPGNTATHQHRDPRNHYFNCDDINIFDHPDEGSYAKRKMTTLFVFIAKSLVTEIDPAPVPQLTVGITRKYSYSVNQSGRTYDTYNPA